MDSMLKKKQKVVYDAVKHLMLRQVTVTNQDIADYIGMERNSVSMIVKALIKKGYLKSVVIKKERDRVSIIKVVTNPKCIIIIKEDIWNQNFIKGYSKSKRH